MLHKSLVTQFLIVIITLSMFASVFFIHFETNSNLNLGYSTQNISYITENVSNENFSIIVLPDTQGYSKHYPWIADNQTQWIVDNKESLNIAFVSQLGDLVDRPNNLTEWENANSSLSKLDNTVPWGVLPGNHDRINDNITTYNHFFGSDRFVGYDWYGGSYSEGSNSNSYQLFSAGDTDYLILHLQYNPNDDILFWASNIIDAYPNRKVIISTHDYMSGFMGMGRRSDIGEHIWHSLVKQHANQVFLVLCGHSSSTDFITNEVNGHMVYQILADYQNATNIESGWLRILEFSPSQNKIFVKTYSPLLKTFKNDTENEFTIDYVTGTTSPAKTEGKLENNTIYIRQDGNVEPSTAAIQRKGDVYTFTNNIFGSIIIERDNVVIDGNGLTLQGSGTDNNIPMQEPLDVNRYNDSDYMTAWRNQRVDPYVTPDSKNTGIYSNAQNLTIQNLKITEFWCGIELEYSANNKICHNQITGNNQGIWIHVSSNNNISDNILDNNSQGVTLQSSYDTIQRNNITGISEYAIKLQWSFNTIEENCISGEGYGLYIEGSSRNIFRANNFSNNKQVFYNSKWSYPESIQNVDSSNLVNGKELIYWINKHNMTIPNDAGWVALINCSGIEIKNLNLAFGQEIVLVNSDDCIVNKNIFSNNAICIGLYSSENNIISENRIDSSYCGIQLRDSINNDLNKNTIYTCNQGITVYQGSTNRIRQNNITECTQGLTFSASTKNVVNNNTLTGNDQGLRLTGTSMQFIDENITFLKSSDNIITGNNISMNDCGVFIQIAENNLFNLNSFQNNTSQVELCTQLGQNLKVIFANKWNNDTTGNYWSDYTSKYPNASKLDTGTWDTPYWIGELNQDNHPLTINENKKQVETNFALIFTVASTTIVAVASVMFAYTKNQKNKTKKIERI